MSIYTTISAGAPAFLASNKGWGDFCAWARGLSAKEAPDLLHLVDFGWDEDLPLVAEQLRAGLEGSPPDRDTRAVADELLSLVAGADGGAVLTITDGLS